MYHYFKLYFVKGICLYMVNFTLTYFQKECENFTLCL